MKAKKQNLLSKNILIGAMCTLMIFSLPSCAKKMNFLNSAYVPAARGYIKIKKDHNKNYVIQVNLQNLAEVSRLIPPKQSYVVWIITDQGATKNIGKINSASGTFSSTIKAFLEAVSSVKPTKVFITAEVDENTQFPDSQIMLSTDNF